MREHEEYEATWFPSPIDLPERQSGAMSIKHRIIPAGETVPIVGMRQALLRGIRPVNGKVEEPLLIHQLLEEGHGMWMSDIPEELNQIGEMIHKVRPQGRVLVGGLGLGILAATVARLRGVTEVVVVEKSQDVINLCAQPMMYKTVCADISDYLESEKRSFKFYLLDTWAGTNEGTWWDTVMPLRRIIRRKHGLMPVFHGWAEDIMWGQIYQALTTKPPHWYTSYLPVPMSHEDAERFLNTVGTPFWEKKYGWAVDRYISEDHSWKDRSAEVKEGSGKTR